MAQSTKQELLRTLRKFVADNQSAALGPSFVDDSIAACSHFEETGDLRLAAHFYVHNTGLCNRLFGPIEDWTFSKRVKDMSYLFFDASPTFNPNLEKWNVRHVENMTSMFSFNAQFEGIGLQHWNTSALASADDMFLTCPNFDADLDEWNVSNLVSASNMFGACHSFNQSLAKWDTSKLRDATHMFLSCYALDSLDVSKWNVARLARAQGMFKDCVLANPDVSKWKPRSLVYAHEMFRNCKRFDASLAAWKEPRRRGKVDETTGRVIKRPLEIFWDAFRDAAAFGFDIPVWMIAELSPIDSGVLQRLERLGTAPVVARDRAAGRKWHTLGARLDLRKNHRIAMEEYKKEIAVIETTAEPAAEAQPQPLPRSEAEAQFYKTEFTTQTQIRPKASAEEGNAFAGVPECPAPPADEAPSNARWTPLPPDILKLAKGKRRRSADQMDRVDYERVYGKGTWAKLPVRDQKAAAKSARAIKKRRRGAATEADAGDATLFDVEREEVENAELSEEDERDKDAPFEETWEGTEDALDEHEGLDMDAGNVADD